MFCKLALQRTRQGLVGKVDGTAKSTGNTTQSAFDYRTDDAAAVVESAGYFNAAAKVLAVGDTIEAVVALAGVPVTKRYVVTANSGAAVTVAIQATTAG